MSTQVNTETADLAIHVGNAAVTLRRPVELADLRHPEALGEGLPHTRPQPIPHGQPHFVALFWRPLRLRQEVAADFPDILHHLQKGE